MWKDTYFLFPFLLASVRNHCFTNSSGGSLQEVAVQEAALQALVESLDLLQSSGEKTFLSPWTC